MNSVSIRLGGVVKAARLDKQLTQKELAGRLSISPHYLMSIENKKKMRGGRRPTMSS
jgi:cytoskeletal protein RodZ